MTPENQTFRIAQYLARAGVASRRNAEPIISAGRVQVNGEVVTDLSRRIDPSTDKVAIDGRPLNFGSKDITLAMNKPRGVVVTREDPQKRKTVYSILPAEYRSRAGELRYAGRLDLDTSGLLILSTNGDLIHRLTHPSSHLRKIYEARTNQALGDVELKCLREGVMVDGHPTLPCQVELVQTLNEGAIYEVTLLEGRNRQIRRMFEAVGAKVVRLRRKAIGKLRLDQLRLNEGEVCALDQSQLKLLT